VARDKCGRDGCYGLGRLIEKRGRDAKLIDWLDELYSRVPKEDCRQHERSMRREMPGFAEGAVGKAAPIAEGDSVAT
jgi:hypothetical protein